MNQPVPSSDDVMLSDLRPRVLGLRRAAQRLWPTGRTPGRAKHLLFSREVKSKGRFFSPAKSVGLQNDIHRVFPRPASLFGQKGYRR